jgi:hypothetical protein
VTAAARRPYKGGDISGQLSGARDAYRRWLGPSYDLGALDCVLCAAATGRLGGDPPWVVLIGGSGAAKTETVTPLQAAGAAMVSTISGDAGLLSGTPVKDRAADATGGLLESPALRKSGLLVLKDMTSILAMNRDTRAKVLAALREIHDGHWARDMGSDGGRKLHWHGRVVVIAACTTAWDAAYQVMAAMGDRFLVVRLDAGGEDRRRAGMRAMMNVSHEPAMRKELSAAVSGLLGAINVKAAAALALTEAEAAEVLDLADLVTRARTAVERDFNGAPLWAHALEMPTRLAKQLAQLGRGGLALGMTRAGAMDVIARAAADTMPPLRLRVLLEVAGQPDCHTAAVRDSLQLPRSTVDRTLRELHLLGLLEAHDMDYGQRGRTVYRLRGDVDTVALKKLSRIVTPLIGEPAEAAPEAAGIAPRYGRACTACGQPVEALDAVLTGQDRHPWCAPEEPACDRCGEPHHRYGDAGRPCRSTP